MESICLPILGPLAVRTVVGIDPRPDRTVGRVGVLALPDEIDDWSPIGRFFCPKRTEASGGIRRDLAVRLEFDR